LTRVVRSNAEPTGALFLCASVLSGGLGRPGVYSRERRPGLPVARNCCRGHVVGTRGIVPILANANEKGPPKWAALSHARTPETLVAAYEACRSFKRPFSASAECGEASVNLDFPGRTSPILVMFRRCPVPEPVAIPVPNDESHFPFAVRILQALLSPLAASRRR
jgi:hypothetical protein